MTSWQPLSQRSKGLQPDGPYEGVPSHLDGPLVSWFRASAWNQATGWNKAFLRTLCVRLRFFAHADWDGATVSRQLVAACERSEEFFLDLLDCTLRLRSEGLGSSGGGSLPDLLEEGASVWQVNRDGDGLERRVAAELSQSVESAATAPDEASTHLREAWANAYGRNGNPSDAWDHALKALECLLCPVVVPKKAKATLGDVLGVLRANDGGKWHGSLPGKDKDHPVAPVVGSLDFLWPNPDRHGEVNPRPPTEGEARSVVALTAALVQAHREKPLVYKTP